MAGYSQTVVLFFVFSVSKVSLITSKAAKSPSEQPSQEEKEEENKCRKGVSGIRDQAETFCLSARETTLTFPFPFPPFGDIWKTAKHHGLTHGPQTECKIVRQIVRNTSCSPAPCARKRGCKSLGTLKRRPRCSQPNSSVGVIMLDVWALLKWNTEDGDKRQKSLSKSVCSTPVHTQYTASAQTYLRVSQQQPPPPPPPPPERCVCVCDFSYYHYS